VGGPKLDASYYLGRALSLMWTAVRWRPPLVDSERKILKKVCENLDLAHRLDETLEYLWREWAEILDYLGTGSRDPGRIDGGFPLRPLIGYRRDAIWVLLVAGWTIEIPGAIYGILGGQHMVCVRLRSHSVGYGY